MSRYDATDDPLCYPGTAVLKNLADLLDQDDLDQFEQLMFLTRSEEPLPDGDLDYEHYKAIHHHFFQDVSDHRPCDIRWPCKLFHRRDQRGSSFQRGQWSVPTDALKCSDGNFWFRDG